MLGETPPAGDSDGLPVSPGLPWRLPFSVGVVGAPDGLPVISGSAPGLPGRLPFSVGIAVAPGEVTEPPAAPGAVAPGEASAPARPFAAARVGGGMFLGFSVFIFSFTCASLATPAQPFCIFGCAP